MTAVEKLEAAIAKLEAARESSTLGPWMAWKRRTDRGWVTYGLEDAFADDVVTGGDLDNVELIEILHRTIDAQLAILRNALRQSDGSPDEPGAVEDSLVLADAILGGA